jgi:methanogen homoaconitase large subunit
LNITEKILAKSAGLKEVSAGQLIEANVDLAMAHDGGVPLLSNAFENSKVWNPKKVAVIVDHFSLPSTVERANMVRETVEFANKQKTHLHVNEGICHQLLPERGHVVPGSVIIGLDSHTVTAGAFGCFATGVGATDMRAIMVTGKCWLRVPKALLVSFNNNLRIGVTAKDAILAALHLIGETGGIYKTVEFKHAENFSVDGLMTLTNMTVECGAKNGIIELNRSTEKYVLSRGIKKYEKFSSDSDHVYEKKYSLDLDVLEPLVSPPPLPTKAKPVSEVKEVEIDQAFIGSCTGGRLEDLMIAARILKGKKVKTGVRLIVTPASQEVFMLADKKNVIRDLLASGAVVTNSSCGACVGIDKGLLADNEVCISSSSRNNRGRMGSTKAEIYLASAATVAASAIEGKIADPRTYM